MKWYKRIGGISPLISEIYPENYTWSTNTNTVGDFAKTLKYSSCWEYIGEFDSKPEIVGYRFECTSYDDDKFTNGKIYQLIEGKSLNESFAFIDDYGVNNGFSEDNVECFEPVYGIKNNVNMKKELLGYKVKPEYRDYFCKLILTPKSGWCDVDFGTDGRWYKICKDAGVLDIWCEPVYKETIELPIIDGHKPCPLNSGEFVRYNNIEFTSDEIKEIVKFMENYSVTSMTFFGKLTINLEEVKQINEWIKYTTSNPKNININ